MSRLLVHAVLIVLCFILLLTSAYSLLFNRTARANGSDGSILTTSSNRTLRSNNVASRSFHIGDWIQTANALTRHRPGAMVQQFYNGLRYHKLMKVCWNSYTYDAPNVIICAEWDATSGRTDQVWAETYYPWVLAANACGGMELVGGVALAGTDGSQGNLERGFYMYGRSNTNRVVRFLWETPQYPLDPPQCINNYVWEGTPCYNADPSAIYVDKSPAYSFVLVISQNQDGYMFMTTDSMPGTIGTQQLVTTVQGQNIRMSASATLLQDGNDIVVWYTGYGPTDPPKVFRTIMHTNNGQWEAPQQVFSADQSYVGASFPWLVRVARDIDPQDPGNNIMMWPKDWEALVADRGNSIYQNSFFDYDENDDEPASSCSELVRYNNVYYNELWTLCFYRGANDDRIWFTGYTFSF